LAAAFVDISIDKSWSVYYWFGGGLSGCVRQRLLEGGTAAGRELGLGNLEKG
jgi:hypothetical protein